MQRTLLSKVHKFLNAEKYPKGYTQAWKTTFSPLQTTKTHFFPKIFHRKKISKCQKWSFKRGHYCEDLYQIYKGIFIRLKNRVSVTRNIKKIETRIRFQNTENNLKGDSLALNDFVSLLDILKIERGPFCNIEKFSKIRYIRYSLYSSCVKSGKGCVIVEGDSFTAQM